MLKIIADDLGLYKSINDGIIFLLKEGKIDGASLMANGESFDDAVEKLKQFPDFYIGAHLVLVEEKSLSGLELPKNHRHFFIKYILGMIKLSDIEREARLQLDKIINSGIKPAFINGHQHLHLLPGIMGIIVRLAQEYKISYIRLVNESLSLGNGRSFRQIQLIFLNFLSKIAKNKIRKSGLNCNDYFIGFINAMNMSRKDIEKAKELARKYSNSTIELGCHPGYEDDTLRKKYANWSGGSWLKELELLSK